MDSFPWNALLLMALAGKLLQQFNGLVQLVPGCPTFLRSQTTSLQAHVGGRGRVNLWMVGGGHLKAQVVWN